MLGEEVADSAAFKIDDLEDEHARKMWKRMVHTEGEFSRPKDDASMILKGGEQFASVDVNGVYRMRDEQDKRVIVAPGSTIWVFFPTLQTDVEATGSVDAESLETTENVQPRQPAIGRGADGGEDGDPGDPGEAEADDVVARKVFRDPGQPTQEELEEHRIDHMPFRSWCPHCVRSRATERQHRKICETPAIPVFGFDYLQGTELAENLDEMEEDSREQGAPAKALLARCQATKAVFAQVAPRSH